MADTLKDWPGPPLGNGPASRYADWLDGQIWRLTAGVDFTQTIMSLRATLCTTARRGGFKVRTWKLDDQTLAVQAYMDPPTAITAGATSEEAIVYPEAAD